MIAAQKATAAALVAVRSPSAFGGLAVILAVRLTSALATLIDVLVVGHEPSREQPRRSLRLRRSG